MIYKSHFLSSHYICIDRSESINQLKKFQFGGSVMLYIDKDDKSKRHCVFSINMQIFIINVM